MTRPKTSVPVTGPCQPRGRARHRVHLRQPDLSGEPLGYSDGELADANLKALELYRDVADEVGLARRDAVISGCIGPKGDAYDRDDELTADGAQEYHQARSTLPHAWLAPGQKRGHGTTATVGPMAKIFLTHSVADYETWRAVFDQDAARRAAYGLTNVSVLRGADNPNQIWLVADGEPDKVNEMMQDPGLASEMERAGVTGPPELFIAG